MKLLIGLTLLALALCRLEFFNQRPLIEEVMNHKPLWVSGHNHYFDGKTVDEVKRLMGAL